MGTRRRYWDGLLLARLKALRPERYRDRAPGGPARSAAGGVSGGNSGGIVVSEASGADTLGYLIEQGKIVLAELEPAVQERLHALARLPGRGGRE